MGASPWGFKSPLRHAIKVLVRAVEASRSGFSSQPSWYASWTQIGHKTFGAVSRWTQGGAEHGRERGQARGVPGSSGSTFRPVWMASDGRNGLAASPLSAQARRALAQAKVDIDAGRLRYEARRTVADLANEWLEAVRPNRKASTFSNWGWLMRAYVVPRIGHVRLDRLSPADVQKLYSELRSSGARGGKPLSGTQVRNIHGVLHNALNYAVRIGYLARNPTDAIDKPRNDTEERPVYTPDQVRTFDGGR